MPKKTLKVNFINGGGSIEEYAFLKKKYNLVLSDQPDYLFCGPFTQSKNSVNPTRYPDAIRIFVTGEAIFPDMNLYDYAIGFDDFDFGDRYLRYPYWKKVLGEKVSLLEKPQKLTAMDLKERKFCNFLYSNAKAHPTRDALFYALSDYKKVDSGGPHLLNMPRTVPRGSEAKMQWLTAYKFTIASENALYPGYTTEKMVEPLLARSVPIYFGNPDVVKEFNPKAFINVHDFKTLDDLVAYVKRLDQDDKAFLKILNAPVFAKKIAVSAKDYERFMISIFDQPLENARRRPDGMFINRYNASFTDGWEATHSNPLSLKWLFSAKMNKRSIFVQLFGVRLVLTDFLMGLQRWIQKLFVLRFKKFETVVKLFGITFYRK